MNVPVGSEDVFKQPTIPFQQLGAVPGTPGTNGVLGREGFDPEESLEFASSGEAVGAPRDDTDNELPEEVLAAAMEANLAYETGVSEAGGEEGLAISAQVPLGEGTEDNRLIGENSNNRYTIWNGI